MSIMGYLNVDHTSNLQVGGFAKPCQTPASYPLLSHAHYDSNKKYSEVEEKQDSGYDDVDVWSNLPPDILLLISRKFSFLRDYYRFMAVCQSWRDSVSQLKKPCLPLTGVPFLLLAEDVAPGAMLEYDPSQDSDVEDDDDEDSGDDDGEEDSSGDEEEEEEDDTKDYVEEHKYDHNKISVGSNRGLFSLLTCKTYSIHLPEAAGRLILGTNKGWLVTLGRDLHINLLHPLLNHQISLPNMLTFPQQQSYHELYKPEDASDMYIRKVAVSSNILSVNTTFGLYHHHPSPSPTVMAIYGSCSFLCFTRLGDKVWTDVDVSSRGFYDIVYHKGNFFAVDGHGSVFVCGINDQGGGDIRGTKIASLETTKDYYNKYLVESTSGSGLLLLVRFYKEMRLKYRTTKFSVWRLDLEYSDDLKIVACTLEEVNDLGNMAIFVGKASSTAVASSEIIKPNCIYFTTTLITTTRMEAAMIWGSSVWNITQLNRIFLENPTIPSLLHFGISDMHRESRSAI